MNQTLTLGMNAQALPCRLLAGLTAAISLSWAISAAAQTTPAEGSKKTLLATIFGEPLYLEQIIPADADKKRQELPPREFAAWLRGYQAARLYDHAWAAVSCKYGEREKLEITDEEGVEIAKSVERRSRLEEKPPEGTTLTSMKGASIAFARASHLDWKLCKSLYEKYGGRVGVGSLGAWIALDGQHALLRQHHKAGDITFHHAEIENAFWQYAQREHFADTYPTGERLKQLFITPPYLWADEIAPVENSKRERIGSALGQDIYRDQLKDKPTYDQVVQLFIAPAMKEFEQKHRTEFEMNDDEIRAGVIWLTEATKMQGGEAWVRWQAKTADIQAKAEKKLLEVKRQLDDPATPKEQLPMLKTMLRIATLEKTHPHAGEVWLMMHRGKLEQYLFDNFGGGRIIHQQFGPEALDARRQLLLKLESQGKFSITDPALRKLAYDYWERPSHPGGFHTDRRILEFPWSAK